MNIVAQIELSFRNGWTGTADDWWAQHPWVTSINSIAPTFTRLKQAGLIVATGKRKTRSGGEATVWRWC